MKCAHCGTKLRKESMYCLGCGKPVDAKECYVKELEVSGKALTRKTDTESLSRIIGMTEKIHDYTKDDEKVRLQTRELFETYLPEITSIVSKYKKVKGSGAAEDKMAEISSDLTEILDKTERAFEIALEEISEKDITELKLDIKALKDTIERDGMVDSDFEISE